MYEEHDGIREYTFKVLVVGDIGTGKTSLVKRLKFNTFSDKLNSTVWTVTNFFIHIFSFYCGVKVGVDFVMKEIKWDEKTTVRLQLWDIAGQERFGNLTRYSNNSKRDLSIYFFVFFIHQHPPKECTTRKQWAHLLCLM